MWLMKRRVDVNNPPGFFFSMFFPAIIVIGQWYQQHPVWGLELLRPVDRKRYFQESGMTLATWTAMAWAMQTVGWILVAAIIAVGVNWPKLWMSVLLTAATAFLLFAMGVWMMRYRSVALWMLTLILTMLVSSAFAARFELFNGALTNPAQAATFLGVVVLIGTVICYDAYRRWLNTELG
jgi:hypothetical protein